MGNYSVRNPNVQIYVYMYTLFVHSVQNNPDSRDVTLNNSSFKIGLQSGLMDDMWHVYITFIHPSNEIIEWKRFSWCRNLMSYCYVDLLQKMKEKYFWCFTTICFCG